MLSLGQVRPEKLRRGDRWVACCYRAAVWLFSRLGPRFTYWLFDRFFARAYARSRAMLVIARNINLAYAQAPEAEREALIAAVAKAQTATAAELMLQDHWRRSGIKWTRHNLDAQWLRPYAENAKQALFLVGHFAGWEPNIMTLSRYLRNVVGIYAPPKNPLLETFFRERRVVKAANWRILPRDMPGLQARLAQEFADGASLLYALDAPLPGPMLPFMGLTSPTTLKPYALAAAAGAPIIPLHCGRDRSGLGFWIEAQPPIHPEGSSEEAVLAFATAMNQVYSQWIHANPDHWYWTGNFFQPNARWQAREAVKQAA